MKKLFVLLILIASACIRVPAFAPANLSTQQLNPVQATLTVPIAGGQLELGQNQPTEQTSKKPAMFWIKIISPQDGDTVSTDTIKLTGQAPEGTVISAQDKIILVPASQSFEVQVTLQEGINLIEVNASDAIGNEIDTSVTIVYEP